MVKHDLMGISSSETIIGAGVKIKGDLHSDADIAIDGELTGDIKARGNVEIGVNGVINADITARSIQINGSLKGDILAEDEVIINETGKLVGNITTQTLAIARGGIFIGSSAMNQTEATEPKTSSEI